MSVHLNILCHFDVELLSDADICKRLIACEQLEKRLTKQKLDWTWFSDEKVFTVKLRQTLTNDRVCAYVKSESEVSTENLLKECKHSSPSFVVSVAVWKLSKTDLVFMQPGAKINNVYYYDHILKKDYYWTFAVYQTMTSVSVGWSTGTPLMVYYRLSMLPCAGVHWTRKLVYK